MFNVEFMQLAKGRHPIARFRLNREEFHTYCFVGCGRKDKDTLYYDCNQCKGVVRKAKGCKPIHLKGTAIVNGDPAIGHKDDIKVEQKSFCSFLDFELVLSEKALIAYYLREGNSTDWIVKKLHELHPLPSNHLFFISPQNVENIKMEWEVETSRLHTNNMARIAERVQHDASEDAGNWPPFFSYSLVENEEGKGFHLGIMTREQEWLKKYGSRGLCINATHHSTRYKFILVTVLVIDKRQKRRPVAYYFCNAESEDELVPFFKGIKKRYK
uniref:Uncharacterized protein n=1 Tax=Plectus sambesii TaxID=2011161 RepID=A0A914VX44_9BILA